jgi:endo-1,4-beta-xylanase
MRPPEITPEGPLPAPSLRSLAASRGLSVGAAVSAEALRGDSLYRRWLAREFGILTTENALKFGPLRPGPDRWDFRDADAIVEFARRHRMQVRGHTLVWKRQHPEWLTGRGFSREELAALLREHIHRVVRRYRGRIFAWDVVNEPLANGVTAESEPDSLLRPTLWLEGLGPDYLELAFRWAHEADPAARLFLNETGAEAMGPKADELYQLLRALLQRGVPVHGVGLQMHLALRAPPDPASIVRNLQRLAALGLEIHVTEMEVTLARAPGTPEEQLEAQARIYREALTACLAVPRCTAFVMWGMTDRYTWREPDTPLMLDAEYRPKPAYYALREALQAGWEKRMR